MNLTPFAKWTGTLLLLLTLNACGGSDDGGGGTAPQPVGTMIGAAGGTVIGPNGATVVIPPGALITNTPIAITQTSAGAPALSAGLFAAGPMFAFTPHGTTFAVPVTVTVPFDPATVPAGATPTLFKTNATQNGWDPVVGSTAGAASVAGQVTSFSSFVFGYVPVRFWRFFAFPGDDGPMKAVTDVKAEFNEVVVNDPHDYGSHFFGFGGLVSGRASGKVFSSATGNSYSVLAESPQGQIGNPETAIGSLVELQQFKGFHKLTDAATLTLIVTAIRLEGLSSQPTDIIAFECIADPLCKREVTASVEYEIEVYDNRNSRISRLDGHGQVEMRHVGTILKPSPRWKINAGDFGSKTLWTEDKFALTDLSPQQTEARLKESLRIPIDISQFGVLEKFTVRIIARAKTFNQAQGESFLTAYFRDPVQEGGGALEFTGLVETNEVLPPPPDDSFDQAPVCTTGTDPEAGVLEFGGRLRSAALELPIAGLHADPHHTHRGQQRCGERALYGQRWHGQRRVRLQRGQQDGLVRGRRHAGADGRGALRARHGRRARRDRESDALRRARLRGTRRPDQRRADDPRQRPATGPERVFGRWHGHGTGGQRARVATRHDW